MTKKIKKLEKETTMYRSRWESSNKALLEMAEEVGRVCSAATGGRGVQFLSDGPFPIRSASKSCSWHEVELGLISPSAQVQRHCQWSPCGR